MPVRFICPQCGASGRLPEGFAGNRIKCPRCKAVSPFATSSLPAALASAVPGPGAGAPVDEIEVTRESVEGPASVPSPPRPEKPAEDAVPPLGEAARRDAGRDDGEEAEGPPRRPIAMIAGGAAAGAMAMAAGLYFFSHGRSAPPQVVRPAAPVQALGPPQRQGPQPLPAEAAPGPVEKVADARDAQAGRSAPPQASSSPAPSRRYRTTTASPSSRTSPCEFC
jgi:hypothetical protein